MQALPALLCSDAALRRLVGFKAQPVRQGVCQRGAATRQGPRPAGPLCPETLANNLVPWHRRDLETMFNGLIRALTKPGLFGAKVTVMVEATALETTAQCAGCGHVTRERRITDTRGKVHASEGTVYGFQLIVLIDARTKRPLAAPVVPIPAPAVLSLRALVTQARTNLAGHARLSTVVFDQGCLAGVARWWLAQPGVLVVVSAKGNMAVTIDAQAHAAAGEGVTIGRRVHTGRHGQGRTAWTERLETEVVGLTGLTTDNQDGALEQGRHHHRRAFQPHPIHAVVVRQWNGHESGPAGNTVFLTHASVPPPRHPVADDDDRRLIEHGGSKERQPPWSLKHPPQTTARAVRGHIIFTRLMFALATAYRRQGAPEARGAEPVGWQRWRRQRLEHTRDLVMVLAESGDGLLHRAESSRLVGVNINDRPPGLGTCRQILAKYRLAAHG